MDLPMDGNVGILKLKKHDNPLVFEQRIWVEGEGRYFWPIPQASIDQK